MADTYAVAVTLTKQTTYSMNIMTRLSILRGRASEDEARGEANRLAQAENPEHSIFTTLVCKIECPEEVKEPSQ